MELDDQARWDAKYRGKLGRKKTAVDPFVSRALDQLGAGAGRSALDLAAGAGRHSIELARRGWKTSAWDVSGVGLGHLGERAREAGLEIELARKDVLQLRSVKPFDLLLCCDFLDRELWGAFEHWVRPGGFLLAVTFRSDFPGSKPPMRYRLEPSELDRGLPGFEVLLPHGVPGRAGLLAKRTP